MRRSKGARTQQTKRLIFARWELECDPETTGRLHRLRTSGAAEACGCASCLNFAAARSQLYPSAVLDLFDQLGIAFDREIEVYHTHRIEPGKHRYGGWFHFVGKVISGADASRQIAPKAWTFDLVKIDEHFQLGFTSRLGLLTKPFKGLPVVQLEFQTVVPWLLSEPEPTL